ncbi:unnamed protein product [Brassica oleracea]
MVIRETKPVIFLFTFPLQGHLNPNFQLANILFKRGFSITVIHTEFNAPNPSNFPHFTFVSIPDGLSESEASNPDVIELLHDLNSKCVAPFGDCLKKLLSQEPTAACVIVDALWYFTDGLTEKFGIPRMVLRTVNLSAFVAFSKFHVLREKGYLSLQESQADLPVPELPHLRMKDLPWFQTDDPRSGDKLKKDVLKSLKSSSGIIFNAIEDLEAEQLKQSLKEFPVPHFCIGPFHKHVSLSSSSLLTQDMTCLAWLDKQELNSVIYVSLGSIASIDESEFLEIAWGLRNSNQPFLWVVRPGLIRGTQWIENLPKGFIESLDGKGKIVKWAPQIEVLAHRATGGFLTHCGWNSTIESICEGVPLICKPSFGDQRVNARYISDVWRIGLHLENKIERVEIERAVRTLMKSSEGEEIRKRIMPMKETAEKCLEPGASGGDTVKLFDVSAGAESCDDPCVLSYTPTPRSVVNSVKWNHTNMVVASVGEDKKISLWQKNGKTLGSVPKNSNDINEECLSAISFSNKGSRYICSGGTGQTVRIWDLQRKLCIKNLKGHTSTITGVMYNCKDEHVASISVGGDLIVHNLASGARASELKDPNGQQILKVLDYSRFSRHLLLTAGDDGTVHLWDTTGRNPKMTWLKQHSAPTAGVCFSPSNDKIIASVGLDKKLYTYDSGTRKPSSCISYESPFSSLAFGDNGHILAAGTGNGRIVFYDVRGKPQPITVLHAYSSSEAVTSLSWQTSKPVIVNERNCTPEMALFGGTVEDSVVIPDPSPATTSSLASHSTVLPGSHGAASSTLNPSSAEETPKRNHLWPGGPLIRLQAHRASDSSKDDMDIFSPVVGVQSVEKWSDTEGLKRDHLVLDKRTSSLTFPSSSKGGFPFGDDGNKDWKLSSTSKQDDTRAAFSPFGSTPTALSKSEFSALTPPEAWGGERLNHLAGNDKFSDKFSHLNPPPRLGISSSSASTSGSTYSGSRDFPLSLGQNQTSLANVSISSEFPGVRDFNSKFEKSSTLLPDNFPSSPLLTKGNTAPGSIDSLRLSPSLTRRFSTYAERIGDGAFLSSGSPKIKKTGAETREEVLNNLLQRPERLAADAAGGLPVMNGGGSLQQSKQPENNFTLQLFQRTLEGTLDNLKNSVHDDMRNLHIEILRQFHMHEMEMSTALNSVLENQAELMKEIKMLRKENQQLRQML